MTTTLNASNSGSGGLVATADASGILALQTSPLTQPTPTTSNICGSWKKVVNHYRRMVNL